MLVSAISTYDNYGMNSSVPFYYNKQIDQIGDTSFNSLTPYVTRKSPQIGTQSQLFDNINEWQNFCHARIMGQKLNVIA